MWLTNLRVVLPDRVAEQGAIQLAGDRIAAVVEGKPLHPPESAFSGRGLVALPGLIDLCGDLLERELEPRPSSMFPVETALHEFDKRLAGAGITTACAALTIEPGSHWRSRSESFVRDVARQIVDERGGLLTDLRVHLRCATGELERADLMESLLAPGILALVGLRNGGAFPVQPAEVVRGRVPLAIHDPGEVGTVVESARNGAGLCLFPRSVATAVAAQECGMGVAVGAPNLVRGGSHTGGIDARMAIESGAAAMLVADESPIALLQAVFALERMGMPLFQAVATVSANPADVLGLADRGRIAPGARADLVIVDPQPIPQVVMTIRGGVPIYRRRAEYATISQKPF